ncbi:MAG: peptidylprolyl isomerase [Pseudomonadota bacterium]
MKIISPAVAALLFVLAPASQAQTLATINGKNITENDIQMFTEGRVQGQITDQQKAQILESLIDLELLSTEAEKQSLHKAERITARLDLQRDQILAQEMVRSYLEKNPVTDADIKAVYEQASGAGDGGLKEYWARHILLESEEDANAVIEELKGGADFATLAREKSTGPSAPKGGDLEWFPANAMVPPFAEAVQKMEKGTFTQAPVQTQFGFHVIYLEDTRSQSFEQVKEQYRNPARNAKVQQYIQSLRESAKIEKTS